MKINHSDLASENIEELKVDHHYTIKEKKIGKVNVEDYQIIKEHPAFKKPMGRYLEISFSHMQDQNLLEVVSQYLKEFIDQYDYPSILCVGLGNRFLTSDALGPETLNHIEVTHYLDDCDKLSNHRYDIACLSPGVMLQSGMESAAMVKGIIDHEKFDLIIAIDALCASDYGKLGKVIQINNVGIYPGSGIGNHRTAMNQETMGCPVIAIGVPTVIYVSSLLRDLFDIIKDYFGDSLLPHNKLKVGKREDYQGQLSTIQIQELLGQIGLLEEEDLHLLLEEILNPVDKNYILTDKAIDEQISSLSHLIAKAMNQLQY